MSEDTTTAEQQLLALYDRVADAPDTIDRLRRFVLDLAVRGKLVEQDPDDEPVSELLERIEEEKARLIDRGEIGKQPLYTAIKPDQQPFSIPCSWEWVPATYPTYGVSDLGKKIRTKDVLETGKHPVVDQGKMLVRGFCNDDEKVIKVARPLIVFGDHTRETKLVDFDFVVGADGVKLLQPVAIDEKYYFLFLQWLPLESRGYGRHFKMLKGSSLPLPPLAEQHRIVAEVEELMALLDRLEATRTAAESTRDRLTAASLGRLTAPDTTRKTFPTHARFALNSLPALATRTDQIQSIRQTILNLAVRGKLVEQDHKDESALKLLEQIKELRQELAATRGVRKRKPVEPLDDEKSLNLPVGWTADALANLIDPLATISYGVLVPGPNVDQGIPFVRAQDLMLAGHPDKPSKAIAPDVENKYARTRLKGGEILMCVVGSIGKLGVTPMHWTGANIARAVARISPVELIDREYLLVCLRSDHAQGYFDEATRTLAQPTLNVGLIEKLPVPLPPRPEQSRIVAKVDELMALCDRLEAALTSADTTKQRLLEALLHRALADGINNREAA